MLYLFFLFVAFLRAVPELYTGIGVETNVDMSQLSGWSICLNSTYQDTGQNLPNLKSLCVGTKYIVACRNRNANDGGVPVFQVVATLNASDLAATTSGNNLLFNNDTDVYYYDIPDQAFGVTSQPPITLAFAGCDNYPIVPDKRICWVVDNVGDIIGESTARCGTVTGQSGNYERYLLFNPCEGQPDNTPCVDNNLCVSGPKTCQAGVCTGVSATVCPPSQDDCSISLGCDQMTGNCVYRNVPNDTPCTDNDLCAASKTCQAGVCSGGVPVVCPPGNTTACEAQGVCNPGTGLCDVVPAPDQTLCGDVQNLCQADRCVSGVCTPGQPKPCPSINPCFGDGTCNPQTGGCFPGPPTTNNCTIGNNLCSLAGQCDGAGTCVSIEETLCIDTDTCVTNAFCDPNTGQCVFETLDDGLPCDDGDECTQTDTCLGGKCRGTNPVFCVALGQCYDPGECNPANGICSNPPKASGELCNNGDLCFAPDTCNGAGTCVTGPAVTCPVFPQCFNPPTCNPGTGCEYVPLADNTPCLLPLDPCALNPVCQAGLCVPTSISTAPECAVEENSGSELAWVFDFM